jgi:tetratricopeptide (TPR) repeat protein
MREDQTDMVRPGANRAIGAETAAPADLLGEGKAHQLAGRLREAGECFAVAIDVASTLDESVPMAEGLRRLGIVHHLQGETATGIHYCQRSRDLATKFSHSVLAAEATMALANMACDQGRMNEAKEHYSAALAISPGHLDLAARIEQNLGIVESVQGNLAAALEHYGRALQAYEATHNILGRARAHHNIGMICADQKEWDAAQRAFDQAALLARQGGDYHLGGLCLLNHAEIDMAHQRYEEVRRQAEAAIAIFDRLGARVDMADAFRMLGTALRFLKRPTLAESRLRSALEIAATAGVPLIEAESCRDIAFLFADTGRRGEAVGFIDRALALFTQLGATLDATALSERRTELLAA